MVGGSFGGFGPEKERQTKKGQLATLLSVSERTVRDWLSRIDKDAKEARNKRIFEMWLACWTLEEIAKFEDMAKEIATLPKLNKLQQAAADHATDFEPPIYLGPKGRDLSRRPRSE